MATDNGTKRDVTPGATPKVTKKDQESFNEAMNSPNNPTKNHRPTSFNPNDDYCYDDDDNK